MGVHLDDVARSEYLPVQRNQHAPPPRFGCCGDFRGVENVSGAIRVAGDGIAHGARYHDGLLAAQGEVQEIGRFLHGGRPVGDHRPCGRLIRQNPAQAVAKPEGRGRLHDVAGDVRVLDDAHLGRTAEFGNRGDQFLRPRRRRVLPSPRVVFR